MLYKLKVNGQILSVDATPETPLLWVLRDELDLTGTKFGCGVAACGACTVHMNGSPIRSCSFPIGSVGEAEITTIEGLKGKVAEAVKASWSENNVVQCGYCQSGQIMSAVSLLTQNSTPDEKQIESAMSGNICRCATYVRIKNAVTQASTKLEA